MTVHFGTSGSLDYTWPKAFNYGNGTKKTDENTLQVRAVAHSGDTLFIDYLIPVEYIDEQSEFIVYDPTITLGSTGGGGGGGGSTAAKSAIPSALMVFALAFAATLRV